MEYFFLLFVPMILAIILIALVVTAKSRYHNHKRNKMLRVIAETSPYRQEKPKPKKKHGDDFRARNPEKEKAAIKAISDVRKHKPGHDKELTQESTQEGIVQKYDPLGIAPQEQEGSKIVGLAKPQGIWSRFIMSQKLGYIMARLTQQESKQSGFWVNLIKAQANSQGKDQSKGR